MLGPWEGIFARSEDSMRNLVHVTEVCALTSKSSFEITRTAIDASFP